MQVYRYTDYETDRTYTFHCEYGLRDDVHISCDAVAYNYETKQYHIPGSVLLEFVGEHIVMEIIKKAEQKSGREILKWIIGE